MKTLVIDCNYLCHQARMSRDVAPLTYRGKGTGVIYGFLRRIVSLAKETEANDFIFLWDSRKSYRKLKYPWYKEKRHDQPKSQFQETVDKLCFPQFGVVRKEILPGLGFTNNFMFVGYEADDLYGSLFRYPMVGKFVMVTADHDMYQLLDHADMYHPSTKKYYTKESLWEQYRVTPKEWIRVKAIAGCSSDCVPGVVGVGEKTAAKFIRGELKGKKLEAIKSSGKIIKRNMELVKLPLKGTPPVVPGSWKFSIEGFYDITERYGLRSLKRELKSIKEAFRAV